MSDDRAPLTARYDAFVTRNAERAARRDAEREASPGAYQRPLERLYEQFDAVSTGRRPAGGEDFHAAILARLTANRAFAEAAGWTACDIERDGGSGRLRLVGVAPAASARTIVPDWTAGVDAAAHPERAEA